MSTINTIDQFVKGEVYARGEGGKYGIFEFKAGRDGCIEDNGYFFTSTGKYEETISVFPFYPSEHYTVATQEQKDIFYRRRMSSLWGSNHLLTTKTDYYAYY